MFSARLLDKLYERVKSAEKRAIDNGRRMVLVDAIPPPAQQDEEAKHAHPHDLTIFYVVKGSELDPFKDLYLRQGEVGRYRDFFWAFSTLMGMDFFTPDTPFVTPTASFPQFKDWFPWGQWGTQLLFSELGLGLCYVVMRYKYPQFDTPEGRTILLGLITASEAAVLFWNAGQVTSYNAFMAAGYSPRAAGYGSSLLTMVEGIIQYPINSMAYNRVKPGDSIFDFGDRKEKGDAGQVLVNNMIELVLSMPNAAVWQLVAQGYIDLNGLAMAKYPELNNDPAFTISTIVGALVASFALAKAVEGAGVGGAILATKAQDGLRCRNGFFHHEEQQGQLQVVVDVVEQKEPAAEHKGEQVEMPHLRSPRMSPGKRPAVKVE